ncbi:SAM-dependent methyltransferase [Rhodopirellula rubra]|uniref:SAM-dependent methyltransferase n=1 Tax=Aporhodopirellula rubra TaxID=980271 RepID=A0A7W5DTU8_9BACT|nr:class I SAM-dependent methyltransferase [Aporhodopirellula rubra]MBB3204275.1 SAM-dependent methyltransferase [Aporhodopirellula rubra]
MIKPFDLSSQYYDLLYHDKDYEGEATYIASLLERHGCRAEAGETPPSLLELGCGTGAHAEILCRQGYDIVGVDQSQEMLDQANRRFTQLADLQFECHQGDARSFRVDRQFDAVISLFHVASYQTTDKDVAGFFQTASAHLKPGGIFAFDLWYGPAVLTQLPTTRIKRVNDDNIEVVRIAEPTLLERQNLVEVAYTIFVTNRATGVIGRIQEKHRMRYYFEPEIKMLANAAGLHIANEEEWLSKKEPSVDSWGVAFVCRKS